MTVVVVLFLPVFLLVLGLVIDIGLLFAQKQEAFAAADMAVLAGAREIDLDRLAVGQRYLNPAEARSSARAWFESNLAATVGAEAAAAALATTRVRVFNPAVDAPASDPVTGRLIRDPTVCLAAEVPARLHFLAFIAPTASLHVHADASLLERTK